MGIVNLVSFLMMFLSGIFFDYALLPSWLKPVADALPLTYFANGIRDSMVYGISIMNATFWVNIGVLLGWTLVTFAIGSKFYNWKAEVK
jgi:ABC-2 type transport system permease protein